MAWDVSAEQVAKAAQALTNERIIPTVTAIGEKLDSGNFSTIAKHLTVWRDNNQQLDEIPAMPVSVETGFQRVWAEVYQAAQAEFKAMNDSVKAQLREAETAKLELAEEVQRLEQEGPA